MRSKLKLLVAAAIAVIAFAAASGVASAAEFESSPAGSDNAISEGKLTFSNSSATISCNITLAQSLVGGRIAKTAGTKIGEVTGVTWANCEGGNVRAVLATPWEIQYESIAGTLPEAVSTVNLTLKNTGFQFSLFFGLVNCLYGGDAKAILTLNHRSGATYTTGSLRSDETVTQSKRSGPEACPATGSMAGRFTLASTQTITRS